MKTKAQVQIVLCGDSMTVIKPYRHAKTDKKRKKLSRGERLRKRRDRAIRNLIRIFCSLKSHHQWFISLTFPDWIVGDEDYANGKARLLAKFLDKLRYKCRKKRILFRFIKKVEWKCEVGLHFHLIGSFTKKFSLEKINRIIRKLWAKVLNITDDRIIKLAANVAKFTKLHYSYLTQPGKRKNDMRCLDLIGNCPMFTFVNKKHFKFFVKEKLTLSESQLDVFFCTIIEHLRSIGKDVDSYVKQMERTVGMMSFVSNAEIIAAFKAAKAT